MQVRTCRCAGMFVWFYVEVCSSKNWFTQHKSNGADCACVSFLSLVFPFSFIGGGCRSVCVPGEVDVYIYIYIYIFGQYTLFSPPIQLTSGSNLVKKEGV